VGDFSKYQAMGNDYLLIDPRETSFEPTFEAVRLLCDRHFGIGADGVLIAPVDPPRRGAPVPLRIFNSDGSECEMSGNGVRMFALHLAEHYIAAWRGGEDCTVRTRGGDAVVRVLDFAAGRVRVDMGRPEFEVTGAGSGAGGQQRDAPELALPVALSVDGRDVPITALRLGNPHTVVQADEISEESARLLGPRIAWHPRFPAGTNVQFLRVRDRRTIEIQVWERAAGYTLASGSSACAAAAVAHARGLVDARVRVRMPGGELEVSLTPDGRVAMTGVVRQVMRGSFAADLRAQLALLGGQPGKEGQRR
jgi:diaminopimelate epimerase